MNNYDFSRQQDENDYDYVRRLSVDKIDKLHNKEWVDIKEENNFLHSSENLRKYGRAWKMDDENKDFKMSQSDNDTAFKYKEVTEILADGSQRSDKLISMSNEQMKDSSFLLKAHGFDENEWEISNAKNSIWNIGSEKTLYSSRISVKPKVNGFDVEKFIARINDKIKPISVNRKADNGERLLEVPLFDLHFGIATLEHYNDTYLDIVDKIESRQWDTILFVIGQDLLHNDGFTGKTTSGTIIDKVNMEKAWDDADTFYSNLITKALESAEHVQGIFSSGNHDQAMGFAFVKMLEAKFPQVKFDTGMKTRKGFVWNDIFIGTTHGDKGGNRITRNFITEFGKQIATAKVVEIHSGHIHHEVTKDDLGVVLRSLATNAKTDDYHDENGWIGAMKRFQLFEYTTNKLKGITYI